MIYKFEKEDKQFLILFLSEEVRDKYLSIQILLLNKQKYYNNHSLIILMKI